MNWTTEVPKKPGYYLLRTRGNDEDAPGTSWEWSSPQLINVAMTETGPMNNFGGAMYAVMQTNSYRTVYWFGPIPMPEEEE
jgi:hypothetical protein